MLKSKLLFALACASAPPSLPAGVSLPQAAVRLGNAGTLALDSEGWLNVAWLGEFPHPEGFLQKIEQADLDVCLGNFNAAKTAAGDNWPGLPLYVGHPELDGTMATAPSFGWFKDARILGNALQYRLEATPEGAAITGGKRYKMISPYWYGALDAGNCFRPAFISSIGLTNSPVIKPNQGNKPLANAEGAAPAEAQTETPAVPELTPEEIAAEKDAKIRALEADLDRAKGTVAKIAEELKITLGEDGSKPEDDEKKLVEAACAATTGAAANAAIRAEYAAFVVAQAVARGSVAANATADAATLVSTDAGLRAAARLWFAPGSATQTPATGHPAAATARRAPPAAVARAAALGNAAPGAVAPPADPLNQAKLGNASPAGATPAAAGAPDRVISAAKKRMSETGCPWSLANSWAWEQERLGNLSAVAS
jgi:hypothetical protein